MPKRNMVRVAMFRGAYLLSVIEIESALFCEIPIIY
jgi:hypothetical protein